MYYVSNQFKANVELRGQSKNHETHHWSNSRTFVVKRHNLVMFTIVTSHEDEYGEITFRKNAQNKH